MGCRQQVRAQGSGDMREGVAGLLDPIMSLFKVGRKDVGVRIALGVHQRGALHHTLRICQVPLLQVASIPRPELCSPEHSSARGLPGLGFHEAWEEARVSAHWWIAGN